MFLDAENLVTVVMRKSTFILAICSLLCAVSVLQADVCEIFNNSFELDDNITDIASTEPNGWDVNMPAGKFRGYVLSDWPTDGQYNLTLYTLWFVNFTAGEKALVSQQVDLKDVQEIIFDLKLHTSESSAWDPAVCIPILMIDDNVVWQADAKADIRGEYPNQSYTIGDKYRDGNPHRLSLGVKVNVAGMFFERYITQWDSIRCTLFCNGFGLLAGDFDRDCSVDANDLELMASAWLTEVPSYSRYNLSRVDDADPNGVVNFPDFAIFADNWLDSSGAIEQQVSMPTDL